MRHKRLKQTMAMLDQLAIPRSKGLTEKEVQAAEEFIGAEFPPDLRTLLQYGLPMGPNWRDLTSHRRRARIPIDGICFDVQHGGFWRDDWGDRPEDARDAVETARTHLAKVPMLVPVWGHRFMPVEPCEGGNPVFSVHQSDVIVYGYDLGNYLFREFHRHLPADFEVPELAERGKAKWIPFWSSLGELPPGQGSPDALIEVFVETWFEFDEGIRRRQGVDEALFDQLVSLLEQLEPHFKGKDAIPKSLAGIFLDMWGVMMSCEGLYDSQGQKELSWAADRLTYHARLVCS